MTAIYILWLRQVIRYFRSRSRIIGALGQPLLFLFALGFGLGPIYQKAGNGSYIEFLVPGVIAQSILFTSLFSGIDVIWDKQFGFLKETLAAPVSRFEIMFGRSLGGATVAVFQGIIVFFLSFLAGFRVDNYVNAILIIPIMFLMALLFTSLGTAIASVLDDMQGFQLIMNFLVMPLFFLSGALFPLTNAPFILKVIASFDPLSYVVDAIRYLLTGITHFGLTIDTMVLSVCVLVVLSIGAWLFSKIQI